MKRLFIAIKITPDEKLKSVISEFWNALVSDSIKWTSPENFHITLAFLGDTDITIESKISGMLTEKLRNQKCFKVEVKGAGLFRNIRDPRVITAGITENKTLSEINVSILNGLRELGIRVDEKPFRPHLTIGRIKSLVSRDILLQIIEKYHFEIFLEESVKEIILYESILHPAGPVYKPAFVIPLS